MGHKVLRLPYTRNGVRVLGSGLNMILEIPQLEVVLTFGVTGFSVILPFRHFGNNTQGHCGMGIYLWHIRIVVVKYSGVFLSCDYHCKAFKHLHNYFT